MMQTKTVNVLCLIFKLCSTLLLVGLIAFFISPDYIARLTKNHYIWSSAAAFLSLVGVVLYGRVYIKEKIKSITCTDTITAGKTSKLFKKEAGELFEKHDSKGYSVVQIDIDKFKFVNEQYGFMEGDKLLKHVYDVLNLHILKNELCARLCCDWFVLLIHSPKEDALIKRIKRIVKDISCYPDRGESKFKVTVRCGIYSIKSDNETIDDAIEKAIIASRSAASNYNSSYAFYEPRLAEKIVNEKQLEDRMGEALKQGEFTVAFQPKCNLKDNSLCGAEALVRWNHPEWGLMLPVDFIHLFEKNGFISSVDRYVFETVCKQIRWWLDNGYGAVPVSVNISRVNLHRADFVKDFTDILTRYNVPSEYIELELTESTIFENQDILHKVLQELKSNGFTLSIDDFGNGYSCLSLLGNMSFDTIKIDRRFLSGNFSTDRGRVIIKKIVELANTINMRVVAEGVETAEQAEFLKTIGCNIVQGYLFSPPIGIERFNKMLKQHDFFVV